MLSGLNIQLKYNWYIALSATSQYLHYHLTQHKVNTAVSQIYTVKKNRIFLLYRSDSTTIEHWRCCSYIMFVPQGMTVTQDYNKQHPEYIMAL